MAERIASADTTSMSTNVYESGAQSYSAPPSDKISIPTASSEGIEWTNNYLRWKGYYQNVPEYRAVVDRKAIWVVGNGFKPSNIATRFKLSKIRGNGKQTFNLILNNAIRVYSVGGDFFGEIIKEKFTGRLVNIKPLPPETIKIIANAQGIITKYEQWMMVEGQKVKVMVNSWDAKDILHLCWQPMDAEIHGNGTAQQCAEIMDMVTESMRDMRTVFHRYVKPLLITKVDTDDATEIANFKEKMDKAVNKGENLILPKDTVDTVERVSIPQYSTLDPLPWLQELEKRFLIAEGVPEVIMGIGRDTTEASAKILYLAWQQVVEFNQLFLEEQLEAQLNIKISLNFPRDIIGDLMQDESKDGKVNHEKKSEVSPKLNSK